MRRLLRWGSMIVGVPVIGVAAALGAWHGLDATPAPADPQSAANTFDAARLLVIADADMAATAYADGMLHPIAEDDDALIVIADPNSDEGEQMSVFASNSVMGWPGATTASRDGRFAYVVASRGAVPRSLAAVETSVFADMPVADTLTVVEIATGASLGEIAVCERPMSVDIAPAGAWLMIACQNTEAEVAIVPLDDGLPGEVHRFDLDVPSFAERPADDGPTYGAIHPGGRAAALSLDNRAVALVHFDLDDNGVPTSAEIETPIATDDWITVLRWTRSGRHLLYADVAWGPRPTDALFNGPGHIVSLALSPDDETRGEVSRATVSKSPEAFEFNRAGDLLAVVNMERTYLPGGIFGLAPGRGASSLSLVGVDDATGRLTTFGDPVGFRGVLPEDAVFDTDGDSLAVVIYQDHDLPRSGGWLSFFDIDRTGATPVARLTDRRIDLPRGAHDLYVVD